MRKVVPVFLAFGIAVLSSEAKPRQSAFGNQSKPVDATVRILAMSSSSRQSFAGNQDIYLADVKVKNGDHRFARIIDQYPGFGLPIRPSLLRDGTVFRMRVTREPECDIPGTRVYLPQGEVTFDASVRDTLQSRGDETVPCFRSIHQTIRIAKK